MSKVEAAKKEGSYYFAIGVSHPSDQDKKVEVIIKAKTKSGLKKQIAATSDFELQHIFKGKKLEFKKVNAVVI